LNLRHSNAMAQSDAGKSAGYSITASKQLSDAFVVARFCPRFRSREVCWAGYIGGESDRATVAPAQVERKGPRLTIR
jgi:hypothetical protein